MENSALDLDQDFLMKFSCMGTQDKDVLVSQLQSVLELSRKDCTFFLEMNNWNLQAAVGAYCDYCGNNTVIHLPEVNVVDETPIFLVAANTGFQKTWRLKNSGHEMWPMGIHLSLQSGSMMNGPTSQSLPMLRPGDETAVSISLQAPSVPGRYQAQWRLCTSEGAFCGDALWIVVEVQEDSSVLGLAEQLSSITTQDRMDIMERTDAHLSPLPPCTPHPSPSSMQGELYQPDSEFSSLRTDSDQQYFGNS